MNRINSLDGLRFLAITLIIASHCDFLDQGGLGNCIFFALSGFFAASLWKNTINFNITMFLKYYLKRIIRIIPVFYCYLLFVSFFFYKHSIMVNDFTTDKSLILNMFFIKSSGHLWFLQQEILFYILVPFIINLFLFIKRVLLKINIKSIIADICNVLILLILALILIKFQNIIPIKLYANGSMISLKTGYFLLGMITGYLCNIYNKSNLQFYKIKLLNKISTMLVILFPIFCVLSSNDVLKMININNYYIGWSMTTFCTIYSCIVIFILVTSKKFSKFLGNRFFSFIGKISFTMYLFHWPFLVLKNRTYPLDIAGFILIYFITICVSTVIHKYIEKPCINLSKKIEY